MLEELHEMTRRIEKLSQAEHDLISEVHPQVGRNQGARPKRQGSRFPRKELTAEILDWPGTPRPVKVLRALVDLFSHADYGSWRFRSHRASARSVRRCA
jgi:hypothetical protein